MLPAGTLIGKVAVHVFETELVPPYVQSVASEAEISTSAESTSGIPADTFTDSPIVMPTDYEKVESYSVV